MFTIPAVARSQRHWDGTLPETYLNAILPERKQNHRSIRMQSLWDATLDACLSEGHLMTDAIIHQSQQVQLSSNKFDEMTKTPENADKYGIFQGIPFDVTIPSEIQTRDTMTDAEFDAMMRTGLEQAKAGDSIPFEDAAENLLKSPTIK